MRDCQTDIMVDCETDNDYKMVDHVRQIYDEMGNCQTDNEIRL